MKNIENELINNEYIDLSDSIIYNPEIARWGMKLTQDTTLYSDSLFIDSTCVIFVGPSDKQLKFMTTGDESDEIAADDNAFYLSNAMSFFRGNNIQLIHTNSTYIVFRERKIILNTKKYLDFGWVELGYKYGKNPIIIDIVGIDSTSLSYFRQ